MLTFALFVLMVLRQLDLESTADYLTFDTRRLTQDTAGSRKKQLKAAEEKLRN